MRLGYPCKSTLMIVGLTSALIAGAQIAEFRVHRSKGGGAYCTSHIVAEVGVCPSARHTLSNYLTISMVKQNRLSAFIGELGRQLKNRRDMSHTTWGGSASL